MRVLDIRDPYRPVEVAHFMPAGNPLTNNVEVDDRGYVYIVDRGALGTAHPRAHRRGAKDRELEPVTRV